MTDGASGPPDPQHPAHILRAMHDRDKAQQRATAPQPPTGPTTPMPDDRATRYAQRALVTECDTLAATPSGSRNDQLNKAAFNLGQLVAAGALNEEDTRAALRHAALTAGLEPGETDGSIASGIKAGKQYPRALYVAASQPTAQPYTPADAPPEPPAPPPTDDEADEFWRSREMLWHVHQSAKARRCNPWAVLGVVLARVTTATPVHLVLPPIVGGQASLNTFIGLVGPSGSGKGAAERVAAEALRLGKTIKTATTGSGEGIGHSYKARKQGDLVWHDDDHAVLFSIPEIDTLTALGSRKGATLLPELRRAWSGEELGFAYADPSRRLVIEAHQYRLCLVAGIQPTRAGALLDDADGGTPQRFLWLPALDPWAPTDRPDCPAPRTWHAPSWDRPDLRNAFTHGRMNVPVCDTAWRTIDAAYLARTRGEADALDGHLLLAQLKAAAALALLDSRIGVTDEDWQLAEVLVRQSTATRTEVVQALARATRQANLAQAEAEATRVEVVGDRQHEASHRRTCRNVLRHLADGEWHSRRDTRGRLAGRDRGAFDEAVGALIETGQIEQEGDGYGTRYRLR